METRICKICGISKNIEEYYISSKDKDTVCRRHTCKSCYNNREKKETKICRICKNDYAIEDFYTNGSKYRRNGSKYRRGECKYCNNIPIKQRDIIKFARISLTNAKKRANKKGIEYTLSEEWYLANMPKYCPVFNTRLDHTSKNEESIPSIDRINSAKGYTPENCRIISWKANNIKNRWTLEELTAVVYYLKEIQ